MIKKLYILSVILALLTACAKNDYAPVQSGSEGTSIAFSSSTAKETRATGSEAATLLGNKFIVYAEKTMSESETQTVFPGYVVQYNEGSANTTASNAEGWDYVGLGSGQTIKYWDFNATNYHFWAYSLGKAKSEKLNAESGVDDGGVFSIKLTGDADDLMKCYFTDKQTIEPSGSTPQVQLQFKNLAAKVRLGLYETVSGYSVKDVKFYSSDEDATGSANGTLYSSAGLQHSKGTYTITYDEEDGRLQTSFVAGPEDAELHYLDFSNLTNFSDKYLNEAAGSVYLGRSANNSTLTAYKAILPLNTCSSLHLKVDYTLLSTDGSGQEIKVKGAKAVIPEAYTLWKCNYAYTYIFKISDNTGGQTGGEGSPEGLYPITFDAYAEAGDGEQGTLTNVADCSITSIQEDDVEDDGIGFVTDKPIDVSVIQYQSNTKVNLDGNNNYIAVYHQKTADESVIETETSEDTEAKHDAVYKERVSYSGGIATFTPRMGGTFRIEYWSKTDDSPNFLRLSVKVIKVVKTAADGSVTKDEEEWDEDYRQANVRRSKIKCRRR